MNPIKYSDLVKSDDSIQKLITELSELKAMYSDVADLIKKGAVEVKASLTQTSGATNESREVIKKAADDASRLERAERELSFALSETGARVAELKMLTGQANRESKDMATFAHAAKNSYTEMKSELKLTVDSLKSLSKEQALNSVEGAKLIAKVIDLKTQIKEYDDALKLNIKTQIDSTKVEKDANASGQARNSILAMLMQAEEKLAFAKSEENKQLKLYSTLIKEANEVSKLNAIISNTQEGSYDRLSAQYSLNKIQLNKMSLAERESTESGKALVKQTFDIYQEMIRLQEVTGKHSLSVGNYRKSWDGLGMSVSQIVRELPAAAVSLNTFFLGISNNVPILVDEIQRLRYQNKLLAAEGKATISVAGGIVKALFSWNTALVILLTVFSMFGKDIIKWIGDLFRGEAAIKSTKDAIKDLNKVLKEGTNEYGSHLTSYKLLQNEWKNLKTLKDREDWLKRNSSAFRELDVECNNVNDADNIFVKNTTAMVEAFRYRAKAAAAQELAEKKYSEALVKREEANLKNVQKPTFVESVSTNVKAVGAGFYGPDSDLSLETRLSKQATKDRKERVNSLYDEAEAAEKDADTYFDLATSYSETAQASLKAAGIEENINEKKQKKQKQNRDLTDTLDKQGAELRKKYALSVTALERNEFVKQRKEAFDTYNAEADALMVKYRKNEKILADEGKQYKKLTDTQKQEINDSQKLITDTIANYQLELTQKLYDIEMDRQINELEILNTTIQLRLNAVKQGTDDELKIRLEGIEIQRKLALAQNARLPKAQRQDESVINASFAKQTTTVTSDFGVSDFDKQQALDDAEFNQIIRSENRKTIFKLEQEKKRWEYLVKEAEKGSIDMSKKEIDTIKATIKGIDSQIKNIDSKESLLEKFGFNDDQISEFKDATNIVVEQLKSIFDAEVQLAQQALEAANERVEVAKSAYDAEIEARNNGYANKVFTAKRELELEKANQLQKQKLLEEAQKRQEAVNTIVQASSLVTASANIWSSLSAIPIIGPALALAMIGTMWTSFGIAKVKARQVTTQSEKYGEGGFEFLEGGSHASGNDINIGLTGRGKQRKAEGGEALAIINKRNTRKYRKVIPEIIDSLNKGTFEHKYMAANNVDAYTINNNETIIDLSTIEDRLDKIYNQSKHKLYNVNGKIIETKGNTTRITKYED